jgi:hypothetical protein
LGIAVASGRIGYALLADNKLIDWDLSRVASESTAMATAQTKRWIELLCPEVVVVENTHGRTRKYGKTPALIDAISQAASDAKVLCASVERRQWHKNKYEEARALARRFPDLREQVPKQPPIWLPEPRSIIVFEALALVLEIKRSDGLC